MTTRAARQHGTSTGRGTGRRWFTAAVVCATALTGAAIGSVRVSAAPAPRPPAATSAPRAHAAAATPLPPVQALSVTSTASRAVVLSWSLDASRAGSAEVSGIVVRRALGGTAPTGPAEGTLVARLGRGQRTVTDTALAPGTTASYAVFTVGSDGRPGPRASVSGSTVGPDASTGVSGRVSDASGRAVAGVHVSLGNDRGGFVSDVVTDARGHYAQTGLDAGSWWVCFDPPHTASTAAPTGLGAECHDDTPFSYGGVPPHPTLVTVAAGRVTGGVDAVLGAASALGGRVVGKDGSAVRDAIVTVYGLRTQAQTTAVTGTDGRYRVVGLPADRYRLCVAPDDVSGSGSPTGYVQRCLARAVTLAALADLVVADVVLSPGGVVSGTVVTVAGAPVPGVPVVVAGDTDGGSTTTDAQGRYVVRGLATSLYSVCFDPRSTTSAAAPTGYVRVCDGGRPWESFPAPDLSVSSGRTTVADVRIDAGAGLRGTVTDRAGHPVPDVAVAIDGFSPELGRTDAAGTFSLTGVPGKNHAVCFDTSGADLESACYRTSPTPSGATLVHLRPKVFTSLSMVLVGTTGIVGTVVDDAGAPVANVLVGADPVVFTGDNGYDTTDASGHYRISGLSAADYFVRFDANLAEGSSTTGYVSETYDDQLGFPGTPVHVRRGATTTVDAALTTGAALSGTLTDESGAPVVGAQVAQTYADGGGSALTTDADGHYRQTGLAAGPSRVCFDPPVATGPSTPPLVAECWDDQPAGSATPVVLVAGQEFVADAVLASSSGLSGRVTAADGTPLPSTQVQLTDASGNRLNVTATDDSGRYLFGVDPGAYSVCFTSYAAGPGGLGYAPQCWRHRAPDAPHDLVTVVAGKVATGIDAALTDGAGISGHVGAASGPVPGVRVNLTRPDGTYLYQSATDDNGDWLAVALPAGPVVVCFDPHLSPVPAAAQCYDGQVADPLDPAVRKVKLVAGQTRTGIDAVLAAS